MDTHWNSPLDLDEENCQKRKYNEIEIVGEKSKKGKIEDNEPKDVVNDSHKMK